MASFRFLLALALTLAASSSFARDAGTYGAEPANLAERLDHLIKTYPGVIAKLDGNDLVLTDGTRLPISDGRTDKTFEELLNEPDIGDMFAFDYPAGAPAKAPALNFDPGRVRVEGLFRAIYGDCRKKGLVKTGQVDWVPKHGGGTLTFTLSQGADKALEAVSAELDELPKSFSKYLVPPAGTFNCRAIAKTERMSMHAYGAAVDINTEQTTYWQWEKPGPDGLYQWSNKIPMEIVTIFEKHGFIWGGRWYHYDTMHFEYRPELLPPK